MRTVCIVGLSLLATVVLFVPEPPAAEPAAVSIEATKEAITFKAGKELVARYQIADSWAKPFFHPVHAPGGPQLTRSWPIVKGLPGETSDHPHQKSLWFCHGDIIPEGLDLKTKTKGVAGVDFWAEGGNHGRIVCVQVGTPKTEKNHGSVVTKNEWRTKDDVKIMDETRTIHLYDLGGAWLIVVDIDLHASVYAIVFGDTKEGSFGVRINDLIREASGKGKLENAEGKTGEKSIWGHPSAWCDYSGTLDGKTVGLAVFDDPANKSKACWHARGYGLMAANPFGREKSFPGQKGNTDLVRIAKGDHLRLRYGVLLHTGDAREAKVAEHYQRFVKLPRG